jgi:hypothetical protein
VRDRRGETLLEASDDVPERIDQVTMRVRAITVDDRDRLRALFESLSPRAPRPECGGSMPPGR